MYFYTKCVCVYAPMCAFVHVLANLCVLCTTLFHILDHDSTRNCMILCMPCMTMFCILILTVGRDSLSFVRTMTLCAYVCVCLCVILCQPVCARVCVQLYTNDAAITYIPLLVFINRLIDTVTQQLIKSR